ncbi:MAG: 5-oxoprolinase subunit PxpB [Geodermatophilaceae bacterium]|nr:5-oxoprolinase subunit PxpB [Geodermatophilaceae bacterium]
MRVWEYGEDALLVELADVAAVVALRAGLERDPVAGIEEMVPAARTVLLRLAPDADATHVMGLVQRRSLSAAEPEPGAVVEIPVTYDGDDLDEVAGLTGLSVDDIVAAHTGADLTVAFCGFAPGFGYLVGLPESLHVPRRREPRTKVPAGAVGLAAEFTGVYPRESPGGWQLIGRTAAVLWDADQDPPALLRPGITVRFRPA